MSEAALEMGTITTRIPARLDRLPWSGFHWRVLVGLGTVWILDGLEVTMVGAVAARLTEKGAGVSMSAGDIGLAGAIYIVGACLGALLFGHMTDRFGRKKLFLITLALYIVATFATAFAWAPWFFFLARFFTGAGIGGEYSAINSAIDELIPARVRGRIDLIINGTYWAGSAGGSALALVFLNKAWFPEWLGWRLAFGIGVVLGLGIMLVRRHVPESPRWLFIHGRQDEAEAIVDGIETSIVDETGQQLETVHEELTVRQRHAIPFRTIAHTAFKLYPKRAILGIALFVGQAFIYNGVTFDLGTLFGKFYKVSSSVVPVFLVIYALGNLLGPLVLGRLFDTVGRKPMISGTYLGSALVTIPLGIIFVTDTGNEWLMIAFIVVTFFLASAGASAAYLTVSEIFPMETRALAIAFFYAIGTAAGGIVGPLLFGNMIDSGNRGLVVLAFYIGAAVMAIGGVFELLFGVKAERASLESIATPLTVAEAEGGYDVAAQGRGGGGEVAGREVAGRAHVSALRSRAESERAWARAAGHRADEARHGAEGAGAARDGDASGADGGDRSAEVAGVLAEVDSLRAQEFEQQAAAFDELADPPGPGSLERAQAAEQRARAFAARAAALSADDDSGSQQQRDLADAATERARSREQLARAVELEAVDGGRDGGDGAAAGSGDAAGDGTGDDTGDEMPPEAVRRAQADAHRAWFRHHEERAAMFDARAAADASDIRSHERRAAELEREALAAERAVDEARHLAAAAGWEDEVDQAESAIESEQRSATERAAEHERRESDERRREERIRQRITRRSTRRTGRLGLGPSATVARGWAAGSAPQRPRELALDSEIEIITSALGDHGPSERRDLARLVGARYWGPGRFGEALDEAVDEGRIRRISRRVYGPVNPDTGSADGDGRA